MDIVLHGVNEKCLLIELQKADLQVKAQVPITVYYDTEIVGEFVSDILVEDRVILEFPEGIPYGKNLFAE